MQNLHTGVQNLHPTLSMPTYVVLHCRYIGDAGVCLNVERQSIVLFVQNLPILPVFVPTGTSIRFGLVRFVFGQCLLGIGFVVFV